MVNGILDYLWLVPALPLLGVVLNGAVALFAVNRSTTQEARLEVDLRSIPGLRLVSASTLSNPDHTWQATADDDTSVVPRTNPTASVQDGHLSVTVPPVSWNVLRLGL